MQEKVLVINAGSSSIKWQLFTKDNLEVLASGLAERIGLEMGALTIKKNDQKGYTEVKMVDHSEAVKEVLKQMEQFNVIENILEISIIGFRVVHGMTYFNKTSKINEEVLAVIDKCSEYAPLHNPGAIMAIKAFQKVMPHAKLAAEFDTAFHTTIPDVNAIYAIPYELSEKYAIRRYGFHGISHQYITMKIEELLNKEKVNIVNMHIGNGASICAIKDSKSIDTSMGLTPLAGIMMGTRSGDVDPALPAFLCEKLNLDIKEVTKLLNQKSGMLGVSGISSDTRDIEKGMAENNKRALFAHDLYVQKIVDYVANYANKIGPKIDALVFTAGVGENSPILRRDVISRLTFANIKIDEKINEEKIGSYQLISTPDSTIKVYVIRTNEELMIAKHAVQLFDN